MKKILALLSIFFILGNVVSAQGSSSSPEQAAEKYGISFPIAELNGCEDYSSCRTFCEDPINATTCEAFARAKGFYQEDKLSTRQEEILAVAKSELGCSDKSSCEAICQLKENFDKCNTFAENHGLSGGHTVDPAKQEIISKAKEVLGCDSETTCRAICQQESNRDKCNNFAKQVGLRGGETREGPGGCTSDTTCQTFCTDPSHFNECSQYGQQRGSSGFSGPGGCNSQESCQAFCQKNPNDCHSSAQQEQKKGDIEQCFGSGKFWYNNVCNDKPMSGYFDKVHNPKIEECFGSGRFWNGTECRDRSAVEQQYEQRKAQEYADYCRQSPDKCRPGETGVFTGTEDRSGFESFCTKYPDRCRTVEVNQDGQKRECESERGKQYGCHWIGTRCDCPGYNTTGGTTPYNNQTACGGGTYWNGSGCVPYTAPNSGTASCTSGQYWNGSACVSTPQDGQQTQKTPEQMCAETSNCRWENNTCNCSYSSGTNVQTPEQQCAASARCWRDGSCQDCTSSGSSGSTNPDGGSTCESHGGHWENGSCIGAVQGVSTEETLIQKIASLVSRFFKLSY